MMHLYSSQQSLLSWERWTKSAAVLQVDECAGALIRAASRAEEDSGATAAGQEARLPFHLLGLCSCPNNHVAPARY